MDLKNNTLWGKKKNSTNTHTHTHFLQYLNVKDYRGVIIHIILNYLKHYFLTIVQVFIYRVHYFVPSLLLLIMAVHSNTKRVSVESQK